MAASAFPPAKFNLLGQKIGPKGAMARQRILLAAAGLLEEEPGSVPSLSAVAREADVGQPIIYRYYRDIGELLLDVMAPVRDEMNSLIERLAAPWPKARRFESALGFVEAHFEYWRAHMGVLFVRNSLAEQGDVRFVKCRTEWAMPLVMGLGRKFADAHGRDTLEVDRPVAGVIVSGMERIATLKLHSMVAAEMGQPFVTDPDESWQAVAQIITVLLMVDCAQVGRGLPSITLPEG